MSRNWKNQTLWAHSADTHTLTTTNDNDWNLEDPKGRSIEKVREIRNEIERRVLTLLAEN
jgi:protein-tyrosine-phosphatase